MADRVEQALATIEAAAAAHVYTCVLAQEARGTARALDARARSGAPMGPLYGALVAVKDIVAVRGRSITGGTRALQLPADDQDAEVVARLRAADAVLIGMTNLHALAFGPFSTSSDEGPVVNPRRPDAVAGGSSGGSAAAVAMGTADLAIGTDTAGSIRIPSSVCGVVGLKGTYGRAPTAGVYPLAPTLDHVGPIGRTVDDVAIGWEVVTGAPVDASPSLAGVVIGDPGADIRNSLDPAVREALEGALHAAADLGARIRAVNIPTLPLAAAAMLCTIGPEAADVHRDLLQQHAELLPPDVRLRLEAGIFVSAADYARAQRLRARLRAELSASLTEVDLVLLPTLPIIAPALDALDAQVGDGTWTLRAAMSRFTSLANLTGHPALTLPWSEDHDGGGIGIQLIAAHQREDVLLGVARTLEDSAAPAGPVQV